MPTEICGYFPRQFVTPLDTTDPMHWVRKATVVKKYVPVEFSDELELLEGEIITIFEVNSTEW